MKAQRFAFWMHIFALASIPTAIVADVPAAYAQVHREPTTALGQKISSKTDEVGSIAIKVSSGLLVFYAMFVVVKFLSGNGREGFQHLLYLALGATLLAAVDQVIQWSQG